MARKRHPALERKLTLDALCRLEYVVVSPDGGGFRGVMDSALESKGRKRRVALSVPHFLFVPEVVARTDLVAMLPWRLVRERRKDLQVIEPPLALPPYEMAMIWHERSHLDPAHSWLREQPGGAPRYETLQWLMFQAANISPIFGQVGFFHRFAGKDYQDKRPRDRYVSESRSLLDVLEARLATRTWIMGDDFTITDIGTFPMIRNLVGYYRANANHSYKRGSRKIQDEARGRNYFRRTAFGIRQVAAAMHKE